jgi:hypothetical protein
MSQPCLQEFRAAAREQDFGVPDKALSADDRILQAALSRRAELHSWQQQQQQVARCSCEVLLLTNDTAFRLKVSLEQCFFPFGSWETWLTTPCKPCWGLPLSPGAGAGAGFGVGDGHPARCRQLSGGGGGVRYSSGEACCSWLLLGVWQWWSSAAMLLMLVGHAIAGMNDGCATAVGSGLVRGQVHLVCITLPCLQANVALC